MRFTCSVFTFVVVAMGAIPAAAQFPTVRLAVVPSPEETGLLRKILPDFERESGYRVTVHAGEDVFDVARAGQADLVIAHYGHSGTEPFMTQGLGQWPRAVFGNQIALLGPGSDPARIRGLADAGEAFRRIALAGPQVRFVSNNSAVLKYLESILWEAAGRPAKDGWYVDQQVSESDGMTVAARLKAYYLFALPPYLSWREACLDKADGARTIASLTRPLRRPDVEGDGSACDMEALLLAGPIPHRIMMSIVVNPQRIPAVNVTGATALQQYLLRPAVQARVQTFRDPRSGFQIWWPAGLHNSGAALGFGR